MRFESDSQGDLLLFCAVLADIPGQPRGVFVSQYGYQKGAGNVARKQGIEAFEIREIDKDAPREHLTLSLFSIATITFSRDSVALEWVTLDPVLSDVRVSLDAAWIVEHPEARLGNTTSAIISDARFLDGEGNQRTSMRELVQDRVEALGDAGRTQADEKFPDPTFLSGIELSNADGSLIENPKIIGITMTIDVSKTVRTIPLFSPHAATYLFKKAMESDHRYVLISEHGHAFAAELSLPPRLFRIGCPLSGNSGQSTGSRTV